MLTVCTVYYLAILVIVTLLKCHFTSSNALQLQYDNNTITWNGCESQPMIDAYDTITVDKPKLCSTRLPYYLEGVEPQKSEAPFGIQATPGWPPTFLRINISVRKSQLHGKPKSRKLNKDHHFRSVFISSQSLDRKDVGQFETNNNGTMDSHDMGYCCGESRKNHNFYAVHFTYGQPWTEVIWNSLNFKGPVQFSVTIVQNPRTYWHLPPYGVAFD